MLPPVFLEKMKASLGAEFDEFEKAMQLPPPVSIRLNKSKNPNVFEECEKIPWHPDGRYLPKRPIFTLDPVFQGGGYYVQEASSMLIYEALRQSVDLSKKIKVLDLCASPGGKTTLLASAISNDSFLLANEVIKGRTGALKTNVIKWGYPNVAISNHDSADISHLSGFFDVVMVDAPCSGEGLFRKDENAAGEWSPENVGLCAARQKRILEAAENMVAPGGVLIYSTCTFNEEEDEANVKWFLDKGRFDYFPLSMSGEWGVKEKEYGYQCYPHLIKGEGFFMAVLRKKAGELNLKKIKKRDWTDWKRLGRKQVAEFKDWINSPEEYEFFEKPKGEIMAIPKSIIDDVGRVGQVLKRRTFGVQIGQMKKRNFVPAHSLALNKLVNNEVPSIELEKEQALKYLKKENLQLEGAPKGWTLAKHEGLNLGWMKVLSGRVNNYFPMEWRIRMDIK